MRKTICALPVLYSEWPTSTWLPGCTQDQNTGTWSNIHIVRQRDIRDMRVTRAMRGAECWADHRLVRFTMNCCIQPPHRNQPKTVRASYNASKLKNPSYLEEYQCSLDEQFPHGSPSLQEIALRNGSHSRKLSLQLPGRHWNLKPENTKTGLTKTMSQYKQLWSAKNKAFTEWQNDPTSVTKKTKF